MIRRPRRSMPAVLVALVVLAACVLAAVSAIQYLVGTRPLFTWDALSRPLAETQWNAPLVAIIGGVVALVGLILLLAAILPGKPLVLPLESREEEVDSGATLASMRRSLLAAAASVDGVSGAKVKVGKKKVVTSVSTNRTSTDGLADAVRSAVDRRIEQIAPVTRPLLRVRVTGSRSSQ